MKRITLLLMALMVMAFTSIGQNSQQRVVRMPQKMATLMKTEKKMPRQSSLQRQARQHDAQKVLRQMASASKKAVRQGAAKKAPRRAYYDPLISEQPEGQLVSYSRSGDSYYSSMFGTYYQEIVDGAVLAVFADDGQTVYLKNLITGYATNGWIKGTISGTSINIELPQTILETSGYLYYAELMVYDPNQEFYVAADDETFSLQYDPETREIAATGDLTTGEYLIGLTDDTGEWYGYGDWNFTMTPIVVKPVEVPAGLSTQQYVITSDGYSGHLVNVGFQGDAVYVQGLYDVVPDTWVKGIISGDKVTFSTGQYLGADTYHQYLVSATVQQEYDEWYDEYYSVYEVSDEDIVFDYDAATKTLSNGSTFLVNAGTDATNYAMAFEHATLQPFTEVAATPAAPTDLYFEYMGYEYYKDYGYGWSYIEYQINPVDEDDNFILADKLSYVIYTRINDEVKTLELDTDTYRELSENMTEIPYGFNDGWDIYLNSLYLYITGVDAYGVQTIYRGAGEERRSEIVWVETGLEPQPAKETPDYPALDPANTGSSITFSHNDGTQEFLTVGDAKAQTYDVAIKVQESSLVGNHIDKIIFPALSVDGMSNFKVWLSTNLRVENGVNVPNLVEVPVTVESSDYIEVELPQPYTIPAEGVYVGYSFTVDEVDDYNAEPVAVVRGATEGGFYIHTSDVYLKWLDMSSELGVTSLIEVVVSGASVPDHAAVAQPNLTAYVKAGEAYTVDTKVLNHGSQGISSLDIDYTINGATVSQHFDLDEPVAGYVDRGCTVVAQLPAISQIGNYDLSVKVTKVNGVDNAEAEAVAVSPVVVLNSVPKHRALLEEYTGTWCGWCVRGFVALEMLAELYPDDYVLVSYHNADPMEVLLSDSNAGVDEFPSVVEGFPDAWVDRVAEVDPYYGDDYGNEPLGVTATLDQRNSVFGHADIELQASVNSDASEVNVETTVTFPYNADEVDYGLEYVLVADGLCGEGSDWAQSNYYSGESDLDENLAPYADEDASISGLVFKDVAVQVSDVNGIALKGSIPATLVADQPIAHNYTFALDDAVNTSGQSLIQDPSRLKVVAILVNNATGEVLNANKCNVSVVPTAISDLSAGSRSSQAAYYDLQGRKVQQPAKGLYIQTDGSQKVRKMMVK